MSETNGLERFQCCETSARRKCVIYHGERVSERETERINTTFTVDDSSHTWPGSPKHLLAQH